MADGEPYNHLGEFIKAQRQLAELSQRELARIADVSDAYVSQLERGLHQPTIKVLRSLATALDVRADTILRYAGWLEGTTGEPGQADDGASVEQAIKADARLTSQQKQALLTVYRGFVGDIETD